MLVQLTNGHETAPLGRPLANWASVQALATTWLEHAAAKRFNPRPAVKPADTRRVIRAPRGKTSHRDCLLQQRRDREQTRHDIQILEQSMAAVGAPADVTHARTELAQIEEALVALRDKRVEAEELRVAAELSLLAM